MVAQKHPPATSADSAIEAELNRLATMPIVQLRIRYRELFRADSPKAFGPDLLRRSIAHRIQEKAYGGLSRSTQRVLDQMRKAFAAKPNGKIALPRRIKPGSVLVREWKGRSHRVIVLARALPMMAIPTAISPKSQFSLQERAGMARDSSGSGPRLTKAASPQLPATPVVRIGLRIPHPLVRVIWAAEAIIASGMPK